MTWISNHIHYQNESPLHLKFDGDLGKSPLNISHGWVLTRVVLRGVIIHTWIDPDDDRINSYATYIL